MTSRNQTWEAVVNAAALGQFSEETARLLARMEARRHLVLIEAVRRRCPHAHRDADFQRILQLIRESQRNKGTDIDMFLRLPHVGMWGAACLREPEEADLSYLGRLLRHRQELLYKKSLQLNSHGLSLNLIIDTEVPYLDFYGRLIETVQMAEWSRALGESWDLLASRVPRVAEAMVTALQVIFPLPFEPSGASRSFTSGWAFGAVATTLPMNPREGAEMLVHEFRHTFLAAILHRTALIRADSEWLGRAPWRRDPRPPLGFLQGCFAYAGLIDLWQAMARSEHQDHGSAMLDRWLAPTQAAVDRLASSGVLTAEGESFVALLRSSLDGPASASL